MSSSQKLLLTRVELRLLMAHFVRNSFTFLDQDLALIQLIDMVPRKSHPSAMHITSFSRLHTEGSVLRARTPVPEALCLMQGYRFDTRGGADIEPSSRNSYLEAVYQEHHLMMIESKLHVSIECNTKVCTPQLGKAAASARMSAMQDQRT